MKDNKSTKKKKPAKKIIKSIEQFKTEYFPKDVIMDLLNRVRLLEIEVASLKARDIIPNYPQFPTYPYYWPFRSPFYCTSKTGGEIK